MLKKYQEFGEKWRIGEEEDFGGLFFFIISNLSLKTQKLYWRRVCSKVMSHHQGPCLFNLKCGGIVLM